jgi:hypothetical protein
MPIDALSPPGDLPAGTVAPLSQPDVPPDLFPSSAIGGSPLPGDTTDLACALDDGRISSAVIGRQFAYGGWSSPLYVRGEDNFRCAVFNEAAGVTVAIALRIKTPAGEIIPFVQTLAPATNRTASTLVFGLTEGVLLSADAIVTAGAPVNGQTFVFLQLCRGLTGAIQRVLTFAQGYITANDSLFFPNDTYLDSLSGPGFQRTVQQANPAAGVDWTVTVPAGVRWQLQSIFAVLTTSAAAANRLPRIQIDDGVNVIFAVPAAVNETASLAWLNSWGAGAGAGAFVDPNAIALALPNDLYLLAGWRVRVVTANIQAADQWSQINLAVRSWIDT